MKVNTQKLILTSFFIVLSLLLPSLFHFVGFLGPVFLPMHLPVLICGFICGKKYGLICGLISPLLSSFLTGMPVLFPMAFTMMFELGTYGFLSGLLYEKFNVYVSLIGAMVAGRIMSGIASTILLGLASKPYTFEAFIQSALITSLPGIVLQIVLVPMVILILDKYSLSKASA